MPNGAAFPQWDPNKPGESLALVYQWAVQKAQEQIGWYEQRRRPKRRGSQWLRALSICFATIGALCPLIDATQIISNGNKALLGQWGYVSLALAAAIVGYDRYFGLSTGWIRYIVTQLSMEKALKEFQYDWPLLLEQQKGQPQINTLILLQRVKEFSLQLDTLVRQETDTWVIEFQSNISELEKTLKAEIETKKTGSIKVTVDNSRNFDKVEIQLNDSHMKDLIGVTEGLLDAVPPGRYEITAIGVKGDNKVMESKVVEVQAGLMAMMQLTLP